MEEREVFAARMKRETKTLPLCLASPSAFYSCSFVPIRGCKKKNLTTNFHESPRMEERTFAARMERGDQNPASLPCLSVCILFVFIRVHSWLQEKKFNHESSRISTNGRKDIRCANGAGRPKPPSLPCLSVCILFVFIRVHSWLWNSFFRSSFYNPRW